MESFKYTATSTSFSRPLEAASGGSSSALDADVPASVLRRELLSILGHELKTPLQLVLHHLETLEDLAVSLPEDASAACALEGMRQGYDRLAARMQDVLDAALLAGGTCSLRLEPCCLQTLVQDVLTLMQPRFCSRGLTLEHEWGAQLPVVLADEDRIAEVFTRLLENAAAFSASGGRVRVRGLMLPGFTGLAIEDAAPTPLAAEGVGVFEAFSQADRSNARKHEGLGLSLFICKGIITAHRGRIGAGSKPGSGNVFWFALPTGER